MFNRQNLALWVVSAISLAVLSACDSWKELDVSGRYHGRELSSYRGQSEVVAVVKGKLGRKVELEVFRTLASAAGERIVLEFGGRSEITLSSHALSLEGERLRIEGDCAFGERDGISTQVCLKDGSFELRQGEAAGQRLLYSLKLGPAGQDALPAGEGSGNRVFSLDELMGRAKFMNYAVAADAEKLFRARKRIQEAGANLLPRVSTRSIATFFVMGPVAGILEAFPGLLPFIFPSNWYEWKEAKFMYEAEKASYMALRANEMSNVQALYHVVHRDQTLLSLIDDYLDWLGKLRDQLAQSEQKGSVPAGSTDRMDIRIAKMVKDRAELRGAYAIGRAALAQSVALSPSFGLEGLAEVRLPNLYEAERTDARSFFKSAQESSLELKIMDNMIVASEKSTQVAKFAFLDPMSGTDIGFGYATQIEISRSKTRELEVRRAEMLSFIEQRSHEVAAELNSALEGFDVSERGLRSAKSQLQRLYRWFTVGERNISDEEFIDQLMETSEKAFEFEVERLNAAYSYQISSSKLGRLLLTQPYVGLDAGIPGK
ncbi:MAG: hypothetical protein NDJ89_17525 [Oligoflexia bacterium]|nr:hypothetical protein [Oligoflexia bacterium]